MVLAELFSQLNSELVLSFYTFCLYFILYLQVRIQICIWNTDPDPQSSWKQIQFGSGSTRMLTKIEFFFKVYISVFILLYIQKE